MKKIYQIPIKRLVVTICSICIAVLFVVQLMFYNDLRQDVERSQHATAQAVGQQIAHNFAIRDKQLRNAVEWLSTDDSMLEFLSSSSRIVRYEALKLLNSTMEYIYLSQTDLRDIVIVDTEENSTSFFSVLSNSQLKEIEKVCDMKDPNNRWTGVIYLPSDDNPRNDSYAYMLPIFETRTTGEFRSKLGTVILFYSIQSIRNEVVSLAELPDMRVSLVDSNNTVIASGHKNKGDNLDINAAYDIINGKTQYKRHIDYINWDIYCEYGATFINNSNELYLKYMVISVVLAVLGILCSTYTMNRCLNKPIFNLLSQMRHSIDKSSSARIELKEENEIGELAKGINNMLERLHEKTIDIINAQEKLYTTELLRQSSELKALNSQINPHFLYNTLECIRGMALMNDEDTIAEIATSMAAIFRYSIKGEAIVTVSQELQMIENYLFIIKCRFEDRYEIEIKVDESLLNCKMPKMVIQPLVENAIVHGLANVVENGLLRIEGKDLGDHILFCIADNGIPFPTEIIEKLEDEERYQDASGGLGLYSIKSRIRLLMGEQARLEINNLCNMTEISVILPKITHWDKM